MTAIVSREDGSNLWLGGTNCSLLRA